MQVARYAAAAGVDALLANGELVDLSTPGVRWRDQGT